MGVVSYLALVGITLIVAVAVARFQPAIVARLGRKTGVSGAKGWAVAVVAVLWTFLPALAGAETGDGEQAWIVGAAVAGLGWYLVTVAAGSADAHRLLRRAERIPPEQVTPGADVIATSGVPATDDGAETPFTGEPAVHTDWLVQRRQQIGVREAWVGVDGGTTGTAFTVGDGAVAVPAGDHRTFADAERSTTFEPDEPLPDATAAFLRERPDLPAPDEREHRLRGIETYVPAEESVTVVGVPRQGEYPGQCLVDGTSPASPDGGSHGGVDDRTEAAGAILVRGDTDAAVATLRRRVRWAGAAGAVLVLGGQLLAFLLSRASVGGLL